MNNLLLAIQSTQINIYHLEKNKASSFFFKNIDGILISQKKEKVKILTLLHDHLTSMGFDESDILNEEIVKSLLTIYENLSYHSSKVEEALNNLDELATEDEDDIDEYELKYWDDERYGHQFRVNELMLKVAEIETKLEARL